MAYSWPDGWNETRTEQAVHEWVCDTLSIPKYAVRCSIDSDHIPGTTLEIFHPLTGKPTSDVHEVFARVGQFAADGQPLTVGTPQEKTGEHTYRLNYLWVYVD